MHLVFFQISIEHCIILNFYKIVALSFLVDNLETIINKNYELNELSTNFQRTFNESHEKKHLAWKSETMPNHSTATSSREKL